MEKIGLGTLAAGLLRAFKTVIIIFRNLPEGSGWCNTFLTPWSPLSQEHLAEESMGKDALSPFKGPSLGGGVILKVAPTAWEHSGYFLNRTCNFFFLSEQQKLGAPWVKLVLLIHYQNQTQINWLTWDSKPLGALPKKALHSVSSLSHQLCIKQNSAGQCCRLKPIIYAAWKVIFPNQSWAIPYSALSFLSLFFSFLILNTGLISFLPLFWRWKKWKRGEKQQANRVTSDPWHWKAIHQLNTHWGQDNKYRYI